MAKGNHGHDFGTKENGEAEKTVNHEEGIDPCLRKEKGEKLKKGRECVQRGDVPTERCPEGESELGGKRGKSEVPRPRPKELCEGQTNFLEKTTPHKQGKLKRGWFREEPRDGGIRRKGAKKNGEGTTKDKKKKLRLRPQRNKEEGEETNRGFVLLEPNARK